MRIFPSNISLEKISLYLVFIFFIALTFFSRGIPFFWDSAVYCQISHYYYDNNFSSLIVPSDYDPAGSPMIYWMYVAIIWKIFGKTLLVSHFAVLPFLLGITWEYYKLVKKFLPSNLIPLALLLLVLEPTITTQSILMAYDIPMAYLFLLALNAILNDRNKLFCIAICLLGLSSMRGIFLVLSLFLIHVFIVKKQKKENFLKEIVWYLPTLFLLATWSCYHYYKTGWWIFSFSDFYSGDRNIVDILQMLRRCVFIFWNIFDFGRIFIWLFLIIGVAYAKIKNIRIEHLHILSICILSPILFLIISVAPFSIPMGHKYFIVLFLLSHVFVLYLMNALIQNRKILYTVFFLFSLSLVTGNFWLYSGGFSNGWDSSLKVLPYFKLKSNMDRYVKNEKINPEDVGTKFPLYHDEKYTALATESFHYADMNNESLTQYKYVLLSNVSNQFTVDEKKKINSDWILIKELSRGEVYLRLFKNQNLK